MATIEPRGNGYRVYWRLGGRKGAKQSTTWARHVDAKQAAAVAKAHRHNVTAREVYQAVMGSAPTTDLGPTVAEWSVVWLDSRTRLSPRQLATYRQQLRDHVLPRIGTKRLRDVKGRDVAAILQDLGAQFKNTTVTRYYTVMHAMFAFAVAEKEIDDNPARRTDFVRDLIAHDDVTGDGDHVYLTAAEYELIRANASPYSRDVMDVLADTGLRWSEATALEVRAFTPAATTDRGRRASLHVRRAWKRDEKNAWYIGIPKGRKNRVVTVGQSLAGGAIARLADDRAGTELLLRAPRGGRLLYDNFNNRFFRPAVDAAMRCPDHPPQDVTSSRFGKWPRAAVSECDCPGRLRRRPTIHDLRHSHAAWLIAEGQPLVAISRRLGHSSTAVTESVYAGILPKVDDAMADAIDRARGLSDPESAGRMTAGRGSARAARLRAGGNRVTSVRSRPRDAAGVLTDVTTAGVPDVGGVRGDR